MYMMKTKYPYSENYQLAIGIHAYMASIKAANK